MLRRRLLLLIANMTKDIVFLFCKIKITTNKFAKAVYKNSKSLSSKISVAQKNKSLIILHPVTRPITNKILVNRLFAKPESAESKIISYKKYISFLKNYQPLAHGIAYLHYMKIMLLKKTQLAIKTCAAVKCKAYNTVKILRTLALERAQSINTFSSAKIRHATKVNIDFANTIVGKVFIKAKIQSCTSINQSNVVKISACSLGHFMLDSTLKTYQQWEYPSFSEGVLLITQAYDANQNNNVLEVV